MNGSVVIDASLAVKWLVNEVHTESAFALARSWARSGTHPIAPYLMPVEVANALYQKVLRSELSLAAATRLVEALGGAGIEFTEPVGLHRLSLQLAAQLRLDAVYDTHYLALAELIGCELWTADERFCRAVASSFDRVKWLGEFAKGE